MRNKRSVIIWVIALISVITAAYVFYSKNISSTALKPGSTSQNTTDSSLAPDFKLKDLNGKDVKLSDYRGKIVILNFWAVWCKYCVEEMPEFNKLNAELKKDNEAVILAVNVQESKDTVKNFLTENKLDLNVVFDSTGEVSQKYGITGYPTTYIIDKDGKALTYIPGKTDKKTIEEILTKVKNGVPLY